MMESNSSLSFGWDIGLFSEIYQKTGLVTCHTTLWLPSTEACFVRTLIERL